MPLTGDGKADGKGRQEHGPQPRMDSRLMGLSLAALGVVFGDIGTSPIYALRQCFNSDYGIEVNPVNVMGILSLVFWSLNLIVGMKYLLFVFRADNHGEGGVIALTALMRGSKEASGPRRLPTVIALGLFAACLLFGDGMITPAISVLSAVEGLGIITPVFEPYV
ncbi:MAG: KUP/HAK/KT family potassium transporter, partial [Desulfosarcinaceae bacterium]